MLLQVIMLSSFIITRDWVLFVRRPEDPHELYRWAPTRSYEHGFWRYNAPPEGGLVKNVSHVISMGNTLHILRPSCCVSATELDVRGKEAAIGQRNVQIRRQNDPQ